MEVTIFIILQVDDNGVVSVVLEEDVNGSVQTFSGPAMVAMETSLFQGEGIVWRSNAAQWNVQFVGTSPFSSTNESIGPGTNNAEIALLERPSSASVATEYPGYRSGPPLMDEDQSDETGTSSKYEINILENGTGNPIQIDPRVRVFGRNRRPGER